MQCNPDWGGDDSLVGYLSSITDSPNPNLVHTKRPSKPVQIELEYEPMLRTGT